MQPSKWMYQYIYEALLSVDVAMAVIWIKSATTTYWRPEAWVASFFPDPGRASDNYSGGFPAFLLLSALLAICFLLTMRILARTQMIYRFHRSLAGVLALLAIPAGWFCTVTTRGFTPSEARPAWFLIEGSVVVACIVLYALGKWSLPTWITVDLMILHFIFWGMVLRQHFLGNRLGLLLPIVGLCASFAWALRSRVEARNHDPHRCGSMMISRG